MKGRVNIRGKVFRVLIMLFLTFVFALPAGATELRADESYPFEMYYDPEEDGWANEKRVNMDGGLSFTVPDMSIRSMDLIVYGTGSPKLQELRNEAGSQVDYSYIVYLAGMALAAVVAAMTAVKVLLIVRRRKRRDFYGQK